MARTKGSKNRAPRSNFGMSNTRLYRIWGDIKTRCFYFKHKNYKNYGARGIKVCDAWLDFTIFREWAFVLPTLNLPFFGQAYKVYQGLAD
jgi:hypothetical protein